MSGVYILQIKPVSSGGKNCQGDREKEENVKEKVGKTKDRGNIGVKRVK
jgi:hypothetical protein